MKSLCVALVCSLLLAQPILSAMTIQRDYSDSDYIYGSTNRGDITAKYLFMRKIADRVFSYFEGLLTVRNSVSTSFAMNSFNTPFSGKSVAARIITSYNLYVYVDTYTDDSGQIMTQGNIFQNDTIGRPTVGCFSMNLKLANNVKVNSYHYFAIFAFDIFKIIVFDKKYFPMYINYTNSNSMLGLGAIKNTSSNYNGTSRDFMMADQGSSFLTEAKANFRSDLPGVLIEDNGGSDYYNGNSWEKALYPNDLLNPTEEIPCLLSKFSLNMAVASGWYTMGSNLFQYVSYGAGSSAFENGSGVNGTCLPSDSDGYCATSNAKSCSGNAMYKTLCKIDPLGEGCLYMSGTDYCFIADTQNNYTAWENYGPTSRCVMARDSGASVDVPVCLKVVSATSGSTTVSFIDSNSVTYACTGSDVTINNVIIRCPTTNTYATTYNLACANDCNGNGVCLSDGTSGLGSPNCFCFWGWSGSTCSTAVNSEVNLIISDPYNVSGVGWVRMGASNLTMISLIWTILGALACFN